MLCSKDFFNRSQYNNETKEQMWMSIVGDAHDSICNCQFCFAHLLSCIFPIGHSDRNLTINQILARDYKEKCRSGGAGDAASSFPKTDTTDMPENTDADAGLKEEDDELANLVAAVEEEENTR